jgi:Ribonuclease G/E
MTTRMLIDARHREETRVAVVKGNRIEEFDFESAERRQLKGNIYLAKVTRVEPSLQAAFVDYGGNRHGFLAFSEIHPDYYQIPKEDRDASTPPRKQHCAPARTTRTISTTTPMRTTPGLTTSTRIRPAATPTSTSSTTRAPTTTITPTATSARARASRTPTATRSRRCVSGG